MDWMFETAMLTAFSISWLAAISRTIVSGSADGKSLLFIVASAAGCAAGMAAKLVGHGGASFQSLTFWFFALNFFFAVLDLALTLRLRSGPPVKRCRVGYRVR